jgi:hypothetical protein
MSSFFDEASLVMIPSGYKDQKVYSVKPLDGSGDLTFSRASSATRVDSNGLIEKVRTNLILQSQTFDNASWTKTGAGGAPAPIVTANAGVAPDGTTTADRVYFDTTGGTASVLGQSIAGAIGYTFSIYLKSNTGTNQTIYLRSDSAPITGTTITATNTWQRFTFTAPTWASTTRDIGLDLRSTLAATSDLLVWGAQWEASDIATDYIATTTTAVSVGPVSGLPRLDYLNSTCPRLLLEPQRTNLVTFSEQFDNAAWTKGGATISANTSATLDPSGYNGSDKLVEDSSTGAHRVFNNSAVTISDSVATTYSVFAKAAERTQIYLRDNDIVGARFNLSTGAVISTEGTATATITNYGNGWYRCTITRVSATTSGRVAVYLDNGGDSYTGNGTSGVYIFGAQIETSAAYATSYIPTLGTSVTRVADDASKTGISSLIGQTEGTLFASFVDTEGSRIIAIGDGTTNNRLFLLRNSDGTVTVFLGIGGSGIFFVESTQTVISGSNKIAVRYKSGDTKVYLNGLSAISITNTFTISSMPNLYIGTNEFGASGEKVNIQEALVFKTALTDAQLAELTA